MQRISALLQEPTPTQPMNTKHNFPKILFLVSRPFWMGWNYPWSSHPAIIPPEVGGIHFPFNWILWKDHRLNIFDLFLGRNTMELLKVEGRYQLEKICSSQRQDTKHLPQNSILSLLCQKIILYYFFPSIPLLRLQEVILFINLLFLPLKGPNPHPSMHLKDFRKM